MKNIRAVRVTTTKQKRNMSVPEIEVEIQSKYQGIFASVSAHCEAWPRSNIINTVHVKRQTQI